MAGHKSINHVWLNLRFAQMVVSRGASVELEPKPVKLSKGGFYYPDQIVTTDGQRLYVECETMTETDMPLPTRMDKWDGYYVTTQTFNVVVPNTNAQKRLLNELARWQVERKASVRIRICDMYTVKREGPLWTYDRQFGR